MANSWGTDVRRLDSGEYLIAGSTTNSATPTTEGTFDRTYNGGTSLYVTGSTSSPRFPVTPDALQPNHSGGQDCFLGAFNIADNTLAYSSYLGGSKDDRDLRLTAAENGALYVIGATDSDDFPSLDTYHSPRKDRNLFISKFSLRNARPKSQL